ncbi:MAG: hypothetical protein RLZ35_58 [Pseudomonadota bacterium]|jgi:phage-related protein
MSEEHNHLAQEETFKRQGEDYFRREFYDLLQDVGTNEEETLRVKNTVISKYVEMRKLGFSEYINLSELENLSTNTKINEINDIKKEYTKKMIDKIEEKMKHVVNRELKKQIDMFEKIYGSEWMYIISNESRLIYCLIKTLEDGIKKEKCLEMINDSNAGYKNEYYKEIADSINLSKKNAETYFHVLMEILRINKNISHVANGLVNAKGFFSKSFDEKMSFLSSIVEKVNRIKHLELMSKNESLSFSERDLVKKFYLEQKKLLSQFLVSSKNVEESSFFLEESLPLFNTESDKKESESVKNLTVENKAFFAGMISSMIKNIKILSMPFHELSFNVKQLYFSQSSEGEKWFRLSVVATVFLGLFLGLIAFVFFSPQDSLFYEQHVAKVPVVLAFYWAAAKLSNHVFDLTGSMYRAYERWKYGVEGHVDYILTEDAKSYFREIELVEMRNYFVQEIGASQRRLNKIKNKNAEAFKIEENVIKQLGLAWKIIQSGGIERDRLKTVKAVQLCLKEIYKIRSNAYQNQFWRYDDSNAYNVLGVFMQNLSHAEKMDVAMLQEKSSDPTIEK